MSAGEIAEVVSGVLHGSAQIRVAEAPVFDSRDAIAGSIFLALIGNERDGHDFVEDALFRGATLVISTRVVDGPCIVVQDVLLAVGALAQYLRKQLPDLIVIGITGSQGKTTSKDLLAWILGSHGETVAAHGSFNNELGAPLTFLRCTTRTKYCVLEMGASHQGEIAYLCEILAPNIGVVLKVGSAHLGEFGSIEAIAATKAEMITSLPITGVAILGCYDEFTPKMAENLNLTLLTFGETYGADIRATDIEIREGRAHFELVTPAGRSAVAMRLIGAHQIPNALAAAAVATCLGISLDAISGALSTAEPMSKWRMELHELSHLLVINDAYNANPESVAAALHTLALFAQERGGQSWAFLGKMHELGEYSVEAHASIAVLAQSLGIDHLVSIAAPEYKVEKSAEQAGSHEVTNFHYYKNTQDALELFDHFLYGDALLFKASRAEKLELLAKEIIELWNEREGLPA